MSNYRRMARTLARYIDNPHTLLAAVEDVLDEFGIPDANVDDVTLSEHDKRVLWILNDPETIECILDRRKILAIKRVREALGCGLKEAKDAVEDPRVPLGPPPSQV